jgi:hypothetical protein
MNRRFTISFAGSLALCFASACSGGVSLGHNDSNVDLGKDGGAGNRQKNAGGAANASPCDDAPASFQDLLKTDWTLAPGQEAWVCTRKTVDHDMDLAAVRLLNAPGTFSATLRAGDPVGPDGTAICDPEGESTGLLATNAGSSALSPPAGSVLHVSTGQQLVLRVHAIDTSADPLSGTTTAQFVAASAGGTAVTEPILGFDGAGPVETVDASSACRGGPFTDLVSGDFTVPPGAEMHVCVRKTLSTAIEYGEARVTNPAGVRDAVVSAGDPSGPDGVVPCTAAQAHIVSIVGLGTDLLRAPAGKAYRIEAGQQVLLDLHVVNPTASPITGHATTEVR